MNPDFLPQRSYPQKRENKLLEKIPQEVKEVWQKLLDSGFEAYLVGGCVRDLILKRKPKDWDVTTNAKPEEIQKIFPNSFYENRFFTVGVKTNSNDPTLKVIEITTFRD
jgi:tRNA nucleotidyltransferase/poly(A) polymerase